MKHVVDLFMKHVKRFNNVKLQLSCKYLRMDSAKQIPTRAII